MKKTILLYGIALALLVGLLKAVEYRFLVRDLSMEVYMTIVAMFFSALGIWAGLRLTQRRPVATASPQLESSSPLETSTALLEKYVIRETCCRQLVFLTIYQKTQIEQLSTLLALVEHLG